MRMCFWFVSMVLIMGVQSVVEAASSAPSAVYLKQLESQVRSVITQRDPQKAVEKFNATFGMGVFAQ